LDWTLRRLEPEEERPPFDCGDADLNEFFAVDSIAGGRELMSVTYVAEADDDAVGFFSLSNDVIRHDNITKSRFRRVFKLIPHEKRGYPSKPAVKIARLAVCAERQRNGLGKDMLDYIKASFTHGNKTGCRFITVDAYNNQGTVNFYLRNGFQYLLSSDEKEDTRLMYFDLMRFIR